AAEWVMVYDNDEYIAYADPATVFRDGNLVQMSDLIDLKSPRSSPYGHQHASSTAHSEFDCQNARIRTIAFSLHSGQMGGGDLVETVAESNRWLPVAPGTFLDVLWQLACSQT
ncbi:MAG: hypothetical protein Q7R45_12170, partial [Sulfuricaulis sp.]|nr:hypothetical protein [Sulfuricaulis sp.]